MHTEQAATAADRSHIQLRPPGSFRLRALDHEDCGKIHEASLELLEKTGVVVTSKKAQEIFADHGATIDKLENRVYLPAQIIEKSLATLPSEITIPGREASRDCVMGKRRSMKLSGKRKKS